MLVLQYPRRLTNSGVPISCLNECLCAACWAACSQDIILRVLFSNKSPRLFRTISCTYCQPMQCSTPSPCLVRFLGPGQKAHEPKPHELSQKRMSEEFRMSWVKNASVKKFARLYLTFATSWGQTNKLSSLIRVPNKSYRSKLLFDMLVVDLKRKLWAPETKV